MSGRIAASLLLCLCLPATAFGWGFDGHRRLAASAHEPFPSNSCLRLWLAQVTSQFAWQNKTCDPDRWRDHDPDEGPRHYLDIDWADPMESYPREWPEVQARFGQYAVRNGVVPWRVEQMYQTLVEDMRAKNGAKAFDTIAWMAHYVTDAFSPMHDTKTQPGTCPDCVHLRYESQMLDVKANIDAITADMRRYYGTLGKADPRHHLFDIILVGQPLAQKIIYDDIQAGHDDAALFQNTRDITARRWGDSLTVLASLIGTAWVEAGRPMLSGMPQGCSTEVAQGDMVLRGYALPPAPPDAGTPTAEDAGTVTPDAGTPGGGAGGGPGNDVPEPEGCAGCGGPAAAILPLVLSGVVLPVRRRRGMIE